MDKKVIDIIKKRIEEKLSIGINRLTDSDIIDILEECKRKKLLVTRKEIIDFIDDNFVDNSEQIRKNEEYITKYLEPYYEKNMKNMTPKDLGEILKEDYSEKLLTICGGMFSEERIYRCQITIQVVMYFLLHWDKIAPNTDITTLQEQIKELVEKEENTER